MSLVAASRSIEVSNSIFIVALPFSEVESIFFVKDKEDDFHTVKKGSTWGENQIRLFDTKVDISLFTGYKEPDTFANALIIPRAGVAQMYIHIKDNVQEGASIAFFDGNNLIFCCVLG